MKAIKLDLKVGHLYIGGGQKKELSFGTNI
jgi:hypothetical protein